MKHTKKRKPTRKRNRQQVYLAHPFQVRDAADKWRIVEELKARGLYVHDPFEREDNLVKAYGLDNYWDRPNWHLAREMWTRDLQAIYLSEFLLAWLPNGPSGRGTSKEMTYAYMLYDLADVNIYVQVICPRLHPAFAVEAHQQFLSVDDFIRGKAHQWEIIQKTKL